MDAARATVFWAAMACVLAFALPLGANRPLSWIALSACLAALLLVQAILDARSPVAPRLFAPLAPSAALFLGVVAWAAVQASPAPQPDWVHPAWSEVGAAGVGSISVNPDRTWQFILRFIGYAAVFWIAAQACLTPGRARRFIDVFAIWSIALAAFGLATHFTGVNPIRGSIDAYPGSLTASFVNRNTYAFYAGLGLMANAAAFMDRIVADTPASSGAEARLMRRRTLSRFLGGAWFYLLGAVLTGVAMVLTQSRAGVAVTIAGAVVMTVMFLMRRRGGMGAIVWLMLALAAALVAASVSGLAGRLVESGLDGGDRMEIYRLTIEGVRASPLLGHGLGAFQDGFRPYVTEQLATTDVDLAHNAYLENAFELGLPAAAALLLALGLIGWRIWRGARTRRRDVIVPAFAFGALTAGALHSLVDFSLQAPAVTAIFAMILGAGWAQSWSSLAPEVAPFRKDAAARPAMPPPARI